MNQNQILQRLSCAEINNYNFIKMLGTGSYSEVFQGKCRTDGTESAIKVIDKVFLAKQNKSHQIYLEQETLASINHPGIIKCYATYESGSKLYLSLELMNDGTLREYMKNNKLSREEIKSFSAQILVILEQIHSKGVVHRDLKPENLMMTKEKFLKLIDFGAILIFSGDQVTKEESEVDHCRKSSFVGTSEYISPELLDLNICGPQSDLWAFGCIVYEFLKGCTPFHDEVEYLMFQKISEVEPNYEGLEEDDVDFLRLLLKKNPRDRLSSEIGQYESLRKHAFLNGVDWDRLWKVNNIPIRKNIKSQTTVIDKHVLFNGIVDKQHGMLMFTKFTPRRMQLLKGHFKQELVYYNPYKKQQHTIILENANCQMIGNDRFLIETQDQKYIFKQREHSAEQWVDLIRKAILHNKQFQN